MNSINEENDSLIIGLQAVGSMHWDGESEGDVEAGGHAAVCSCHGSCRF